MSGRIITLCVGQCGAQLGYRIWEQYINEHNISKDGTKPNKSIHTDTSFETFFDETEKGKYKAINLFIDSDPNSIEQIQSSEYSQLFDSEYSIHSNRDCSNNFAIGHNVIGKEMIDKISTKLRKLVEESDLLQGFIFNHSLGGGTGSGLTAKILERLSVDYRKKVKLGIHVYPQSNDHIYNTLLSQYSLTDSCEVSLVFDNEMTYDLCHRLLKVRRPTYDTMNRLINKAISSLTTNQRFEGELNVHLSELQTNMVPFPRMHFLLPSMSPIVPKSEINEFQWDVRDICEGSFLPSNFFVKCTDFDAESDKSMAINMSCRGDIKSKEAEAMVQYLKTNKRVTFIEWCPTGFKIGLTDETAVVSDKDDIGHCKKSILALSNNTCLGRVFQQRIQNPFKRLYSKRAFVDCYVRHGMEEGEFAEANENLGCLWYDYVDVLDERSTDDDDEDTTDDDENV